MSIYYVANIVLSTSHIAVKKKADKNFSATWSLCFVDRIDSINKQNNVSKDDMYNGKQLKRKGRGFWDGECSCNFKLGGEAFSD